jgi:hypothetical protein
MALKWGVEIQHPKAPRSGKKQDPIDFGKKIAISLTTPSLVQAPVAV